MRIQSLTLHPVTIPRIYTTRVAPAGGHAEGKEGSTYLLLEVTTDNGVTGIGEVSDIEYSWQFCQARKHSMSRWLRRFSAVTPYNAG